MPVVVESNSITIIAVYSGCGNNRSTEITSNIFDGCFRVTKVRLGINIEPLLMLAVTFGLDFFKGRSDLRFHFIQECSAECIAKVAVVKVLGMAPEAIVTKPTF